MTPFPSICHCEDHGVVRGNLRTPRNKHMVLPKVRKKRDCLGRTSSFLAMTRWGDCFVVPSALLAMTGEGSLTVLLAMTKKRRGTPLNGEKRIKISLTIPRKCLPIFIPINSVALLISLNKSHSGTMQKLYQNTP